MRIRRWSAGYHDNQLNWIEIEKGSDNASDHELFEHYGYIRTKNTSTEIVWAWKKVVEEELISTDAEQPTEEPVAEQKENESMEGISLSWTAPKCNEEPIGAPTEVGRNADGNLVFSIRMPDTDFGNNILAQMIKSKLEQPFTYMSSEAEREYIKEELSVNEMALYIQYLQNKLEEYEEEDDDPEVKVYPDGLAVIDGELYKKVEEGE